MLLIDEYSTGIDPATKRHMWATLKELSVGKAVLITTHSMEEAAYLSNRVAIISGRLLGGYLLHDCSFAFPYRTIFPQPSARLRTSFRGTQCTKCT